MIGGPECEWGSILGSLLGVWILHVGCFEGVGVGCDCVSVCFFWGQCQLLDWEENGGGGMRGGI